VRKIFPDRRSRYYVSSFRYGSREAALVNTLSAGDRVLLLRQDIFRSLAPDRGKIRAQGRLRSRQLAQGASADELAARLADDKDHSISCDGRSQ